MFFMKPRNVVNRLFYTIQGQQFVSALFGVGLAMLFRKICNDRTCIVIQGPPLQEIENTIYKIKDECYKYTPYVVPCDSSKSSKS